ncbi:MAG: T9SS type A sorting domain-containing protein [Crocinitomicaceae bacterium]
MPLIYPNPSNSEFTIDLRDFKNVSFKIYSVTGQIVFSDSKITAGYTHQFNLGVPPGTYFLEMIEDGRKQYYKLIVN